MGQVLWHHRRPAVPAGAVQYRYWRRRARQFPSCFTGWRRRSRRIGTPAATGRTVPDGGSVQLGMARRQGARPFPLGTTGATRLRPRPTMAPRLRKLMLTAHVASAVGWPGAVVAYLALDITVVIGRDLLMVRAAYSAMALIIWYAIVPLALASVLIGVITALGTPWRLIRHYWVLLKFVLTGLATIILVQEAQVVSALADTAVLSGDPRQLPGTLLHSIGGLLILLAIVVVAIFKPRGLTRYGWRAQNEWREAAV